MTFQEYLNYFQHIIDTDQHSAPYDQPDYLEYTKLNWSRMHRWLKTGKLQPELIEKLKAINAVQHWTVITEPWCGDAAHSVPFIALMASENPFIQISFELRDSEPHLINKYLTNGAKSIPKLIIQDNTGEDKVIWGPRPADCQELYLKLMGDHLDHEIVKTELQKWYNSDKGKSIQSELSKLINGI